MSEPSTDQGGYIDAVNETPPGKPEGAPELVPLLQLPRRKRADVIRRLGKLRERQHELPGLGDTENIDAAEESAPRTPEQEKQTLEQAAGMFELLADMEEMLAEVAADRDEFSRWLAQADDQALSTLAGYYLRTFQVGEAPASPAS